MAPPAMPVVDNPHPHPFSSPSKVSSEDDRENADGAVDEFPASAPPPLKRPRGRPAGSKNKPKAPTYLSVDPQDALRSHVLELPSGADIPSSLSSYARSRGRGVAVLHAIGSVSGLTFRHHQANSSSPPLFLKGKLDILALSGTVLPDNASMGPAGLTAFVAGPNGQVIGGPVEGRLLADGTVVVMAATFSTATYEKLPLQDPPPVHQELGPDPGPDPAMEDPRYHPPQPPTGFNVNHHQHQHHQEASSYAWFVQQQQHHQHSNINGRSVYLNNN